MTFSIESLLHFPTISDTLRYLTNVSPHGNRLFLSNGKDRNAHHNVVEELNDPGYPKLLYVLLQVHSVLIVIECEVIVLLIRLCLHAPPSRPTWQRTHNFSYSMDHKALQGSHYQI
jgi:hypothetical protein